MRLTYWETLSEKRHKVLQLGLLTHHQEIIRNFFHQQNSITVSIALYEKLVNFAYPF